MRHALEGHDTYYPEWAMCLDMANGNPILAKQIYNEIDQEWFIRWAVWKRERQKAHIPDIFVGLISREKK